MYNPCVPDKEKALSTRKLAFLVRTMPKRRISMFFLLVLISVPVLMSSEHQPSIETALGCEQVLAKWWWVGDSWAAEPVDKGFMPPFQGTSCALDPSGTCNWSDH